ncbi:hypothetical protein V8C43DRAFT_268268 [Trichoderma afarasin]
MLSRGSLKTKGRRETKSSAFICIFLVVDCVSLIAHPITVLAYRSSQRAYEDRGVKRCKLPTLRKRETSCELLCVCSRSKICEGWE